MWNCFLHSAMCVLSTRHAPIDERAIAAHDALIVICDQRYVCFERFAHYLSVQLIERSYTKQLRSRSPVSLLSTHVGPQAMPLS